MGLVRQRKEWNLTSNKSIKGKTLCKSTIDRISKDPFYGEMYIKKHDKKYPHKYEHIIIRALFGKYQSIARGRGEQCKKQDIQTTEVNNG